MLIQPQDAAQMKESSLLRMELFAPQKSTHQVLKMASQNLSARSVASCLKTMDVREMRLYLHHPKLSQFVLPKERLQIPTAMQNFIVFWLALVNQQMMIHVVQLQMPTALMVQLANVASSATVDKGCAHFHLLPSRLCDRQFSAPHV